MRVKQVPAAFLLAATIALPFAARADDPFAINLTLKEHKFEPPEIKAPANKPIEITLKNEDKSFEEFDRTGSARKRLSPGAKPLP